MEVSNQEFRELREEFRANQKETRDSMRDIQGQINEVYKILINQRPKINGVVGRLLGVLTFQKVACILILWFSVIGSLYWLQMEGPEVYEDAKSIIKGK